jgi:GNAT superfamily N-acetyltransferase
MRAVTARERPDLQGRVDSREIWPEYNLHGDVLNRYWGRLDEAFPEFQAAVVDDRGELLGELHSVPIPWDGTAGGLPGGIDGAVEAAFEHPGRDALCALAAEVLPSRRGAGLAERFLAELAGLARGNGIGTLLAPLRPSLKERYPLTPIDRYASWTREDGLPFDPWLRTHVRAGGEVLATEPRSLRITGTVEEWETWTGLRLPESGEYVFPQGLAPLRVDREADRGEYWEPNVWVLHRVS